MTVRKLSRNERKVLNLLVSGQSVSMAARRLKMPYSSVYDITNRLVYYGLIRRVPGTRSPALYESTSPEADAVTEIDGQSPIGDCDGEIRKTQGGAKFCPSLPKFSEVVGQQSETDDVAVAGVYRGDHPPEGFGRIHIAGGVYYDILEVGSFDEIKDSRGLYIGYWNATKRLNGVDSTSGAIRIFSQEATFRFQQGNRGRMSFEFHPAKEIYVDPRHFKGPDDAALLILRDAAYVADVLRQNGWQCVNPYIQGNLHLAWPDHLLIQHYDRNTTYQNGDLVVDCSLGRPELEMEHLETVEDWKKAQLMAELPSRFLAMEATVLADRKAICETRESFKDSDRELREAVSHNARALEVLGLDVNQIISVLERTDQALLAATSALGHIAEHSALLVQINSNLVKLHSDDAQRRLDSYNVPPQPAGHHESDSTVQSKPSRFPMEGYQ